MKMPKNENQKTNEFGKKSIQNKKIYITLGACLVTISAIAWSTYKTVNTFISPFKSSPASTQSNKFSKNKEDIDTDKASIIDEKNSIHSSSKNGQPIPYGTSEKNKSKIPESSPEKVQQVSASPSNQQIIYPIDGNDILKEFSNGNPVYSITMGDWRTHEGIDFKAQAGSIVKAIAEGVVKDVYQDSSYGTTAAVEHPFGFTAYYSGLDEKNLIEKGSKIKAGDQIGTIGKIPCEIADPPHLHFSIFKDSKFIDPMLILDKKS